MCPACGRSEHHAFGQKLGYDLEQCSRCGSIFINIGAIEPGALTTLYDRYYDHAQDRLSPAASGSLERLVRSYEPLCTTGRWLDIGFGQGLLLDIAEQHGWRCYGTEVAPSSLSYGERRGWIVTTDASTDPRFPPEGFDVVSMIEVIEHMAAPKAFLQAAARWLRPGGLLHITTPNAESLNRRLLGVQWSIFSPPEHIIVWTAGALHRALTEAGFIKLQIRTEGLNPSEILSRWRRDENAPPVDRHRAAVAWNEAMTRSSGRRALKTGINRGLSLLRMGDTLKARGFCNPHLRPTE
jgi:SAM-dependent methyltransferase